MGRKIRENLFSSSEQKSVMQGQSMQGEASLQEGTPLQGTSSPKTLSLKDWQELLSRVDQIQLKLESSNEKVNMLYSKIMGWLGQVREKWSTVSKAQKDMELAMKDLRVEWERKWKQELEPDRRKADQKRIMSLLQTHSQFMQSYDKHLESLKSALSKNEYQLYQVKEWIRTLRVELDLINQKPSLTKRESFYSDLQL